MIRPPPAALDKFLANEHDHAVALKRGGGVTFVSWPDDNGELIVEPAQPGLPVERQFDLEWARTTFANALRRLEQEFVR